MPLARPAAVRKSAYSLTHAQRDRGPRGVNARRRIRLGDFFDMNAAAGTGYGYERLARAAD